MLVVEVVSVEVVFESEVVSVIEAVLDIDDEVVEKVDFGAVEKTEEAIVL